MRSALVKELAAELGFDLCGIAPIDRFSGLPELADPARILPGCRSVIALARRFPTSVLAEASAVPYTIVRNVLSREVDEAGVALARRLEEGGAIAIATGALEPCNYDETLDKTLGLVSLKNAARQAGLGVIGKNTLLITPRYGNMVWLGAILTDSELEPDPLLQGRECPAGCRACIEACPVGALDGSEFMDQGKCWAYAFGAEGRGEWRIKCHACRSACPRCRGFEKGASE
jgi:Uncharacterized Fe-S protein